MPSEEDTFITIHIQGTILPADLLQRIVTGDASLGGLNPGDYHLAEGEKLNEAINRSWNRLSGLWSHYRVALQALPESDLGTTLTRERWLLPLFHELGYGRLQTARAIGIKGKSFPISHSWGNTPVHLVGSRVDLDVKKAGVAGAARSSPHSLVQELLNTSEAHLWAFVSNGLILRILRDNASLVRQAYVEFDLAAMFDNQAYADFVLLWLICHQSRVESERPEECWLERWSKDAQQHGARALEKLREGVEKAISVLGSGFLKHPANQALKDRLRVAALLTQDYYRQILRLVYRLLFLFVAEDRDLLLAPGASEESCSRYIKYYSTSRLRRLADHLRGTRHTDLYQLFRLVTTRLGSDTGCPELGLPALDGFLFSKEAIPDLESCELSNGDLLNAVRALAFLPNESGRRPVDYKNLRSEELGSVYEALLELHPRLNTDAGTFELTTAAGHERKATGSYYTPECLVLCLLDSALDPVLEEACRKPNPEEAILQLKVCDPACGSGHFPIAAAHRIAKRLASIRTGDEEPAPSAMQKALRDVIGHCIYGVDQNPMAVELCKVALWIESLEPGKPLSFLDHHIQCGNSLLGTTPALLKKGIPHEAFTPIEADDKELCKTYKKQNKEERKGIQTLPFEQPEPWMQLGNLATAMVTLDSIADDTVGGVRDKQQRYEELVRSSGYLYGRLLADAWCAAFVWKKSQDPALPYPITESIFRAIERNPHSTPAWMKTEIQRLTHEYRFFHWHLAFPDVFRVPSSSESAENEHTGWSEGFDVVLSNPPWERVKIQEREWFAECKPAITNAPNAAARKRLIDLLKEDDPGLHQRFLDELRRAEGESHYMRSSGNYPLCGRGDINVYSVFAEEMRNLLNEGGRLGCVLPTGIATDDTTKFFFQNVIETKSLVSLFDFENKGVFFPGVHSSYKFCLFTCGRGVSPTAESAQFMFFAHAIEDLHDPNRWFTLSPEVVALVNPTSRTAPTFRSRADAFLNIAIYRRVKSFSAAESWQPEFFKKMFDFGIHANLITFAAEPPSQDSIGMYEAKMVHLFTHRASTYKDVSESDRENGAARDLAKEELQNPDVAITPRCWVQTATFKERMAGRNWRYHWFLSMRDKARSTDERTAIIAVRPYAPSNDTLPSIFLSQDALHLACLAANLSMFILDYVARQKVGGINFGAYIAEQLPVLQPAKYMQVCAWGGGLQNYMQWLVARSLELTYTAYDLTPFAHDCGWSGPPFRWDVERRFLLRCELDAAFFHLYLPSDEAGQWKPARMSEGAIHDEKPEELAELKSHFPTPRDAAAYIMDTFPIVKRKDEDQFGEYRTKSVILEIYDAMAEAIRTGQPYRTRLNPPPGPPTNDLPDWPAGEAQPANWPSHIHSPHRN